MSFARTLVASLAVALAIGSATMLTTSCRTQPGTGAADGRAKAARAPGISPRELAQLRALAQIRPTIETFVRGLNRGDAGEISATFLEIGTLEPGDGKAMKGRRAIRSYYGRRAGLPAVPLSARIDQAVIGSDRASVQATLLPSDAQRRPPPEYGPCGKSPEPVVATFELRRSAPTDWHIERATLATREESGKDNKGQDGDDGRRDRA